MCGWVKHRIRYLRDWRRYVNALAKSVEELLPNARVYVAGGAAEDRLTVLSDVDVLVVVDKPLAEPQQRRLKADIIWNAEKHGLPWDYPVEIHIITGDQLKKHAGRLIPVKAKDDAGKTAEARGTT